MAGVAGVNDLLSDAAQLTDNDANQDHWRPIETGSAALGPAHHRWSLFPTWRAQVSAPAILERPAGGAGPARW